MRRLWLVWIVFTLVCAGAIARKYWLNVQDPVCGCGAICQHQECQLKACPSGTR